jgi:hypothetical protein
MNQGRSVFAQITELLPRKAFDNAIRRYGGNRRVRGFSCMDQLLCMLFAQLTACDSLRESVSCLRALGPQLYHCGIRSRIARSTLADANENRDYRIFMDLALVLIAAAQTELPADPQLRRLKARAYAVDSTTIDLCLQLFPWASFRRAKGAVKAHTLLDLHLGIPVFVRVSCGKSHDVLMLDHLTILAGAFYVFDKAYLDFARLFRLHTQGAFFVTRPKRGMDFRVLQWRAIDTQRGVRSDRLIRLRGPKSRKRYPDTLRLIRYVDPQTGRRLSFLTNNHKLSPLTIALLYRKRWKIEQFFRWIKQHLRIKAFFGTTPNAVQTQVWIAVATYVLLARIKHRHQITQELGEIANIVRVSLLQKTLVFQLFSPSESSTDNLEDHKQLLLFK